MSALEVGVYDLLLDRYYATERPILDAEANKMARAKTVQDRAAVKAVLSEFFKHKDGKWHHNYADRVIAKAREKAEQNRDIGKLGGRPKKTQTVSGNNPEETQTVSPQNPIHYSTKPLEEKKPPDGGADPRALMWKTGVAVLERQGMAEDAARRFLGQFAKQETKLAEVLAHCAANPKVDAKAYIVAAINGGAKAERAAAEAFEEVRQRIRDGKPPGSWTHQQTDAALDAVGGWPTLKGANARDNDFRRPQFVAAFNAARSA